MEVKPIHIYFSDDDRDYICSEIDDALKRGFVSQGKNVESFEKNFAEYTGARFAVALSSGSAAIEIAMRIKNVAGKTVIIPANTNYATAVGPLRAGAKIKLADIDMPSLSPSIENLELVWSPEVAGVIIVHMGGIISKDIVKIRDWCKSKNIWLFEDCAHAHGSKLDGVHAGRFGFSGGFSFFATKVITSCEGGMLITDNEEVYKKACLHRNLGKPDLWKNYHVLEGTNARMSEFNALIGNVQLSHLDEIISWREQVVLQYNELLTKHKKFRLIQPFGRNSWYKYILMLPDRLEREKTKTALRKCGVTLSGEIYEMPLHRQPVWRHEVTGGKYPVTDEYCLKHICLPIYYGMTGEKVNYVVKSLIQVAEGKGI